MALLASCLLHGVIVLPYAGTGNRIAYPRLPGATPHAFSASLTTKSDSTEVPLTTETATTGAVVDPVAELNSPPDPPEQSAGAELLPLPAPAFYATDRLTKRPQPEFVAELDTLETKPLVASGKIILQLWINDLGKVVDVLVEKSDLPDVFSQAAVAAFKQARFTPGELNGLRVGSIMRIEVSYDDILPTERENSAR